MVTKLTASLQVHEQSLRVEMVSPVCLMGSFLDRRGGWIFWSMPQKRTARMQETALSICASFWMLY